MSNFLFNCCHSSEVANYSEATISSISRNINNKHKKTNNINVPKSSLKTLASMRSLKSFENGSKSALTYTPPSQHLPTPLTRNLYPISTTGFNSLLCTPQRSQIMVNPPAQEITPTRFSNNSKIKFSYSADKRCDKEETILSPKNPNVARLNDKNFRSSKFTKQETVEKQETFQQPRTKQSNMIRSVITSQGKPEKIRLGGSKFTILSEQQLQQLPIDETSLKLDQSEIIINVFHPTDSQLQKWSADRKVQTNPTK